MMKNSIFFTVGLAAAAVLANPIAHTERDVELPLNVSVVGSLPVGSWLENLAVRENGQVLGSRLDTPAIVQFDPTGAVEPTTVFAWNASEYRGALGISETTPDVFYVILSAFINSTTFVKTGGNNTIFEIDMNTFVLEGGLVTQNATVTKLVDVVESDSLNGLTTLDDSNILAGDAYNGWVYKINTQTGAYGIVVNDPNMKPAANASTHLGVNGLKIFQSYLYWTNAAASTLNKIQIAADGTPIGNSSVFPVTVGGDDFAFKSDGTIFLARNSGNELAAILPGTTEMIIVAGSTTATTLAGPTACRFGTTAGLLDRLYISTSGAKNHPINGTITVGASISYVDTSGY